MWAEKSPFGREQKFIKKVNFGQKGGPVPPKAPQGSASAPGPWCHFNGEKYIIASVTLTKRFGNYNYPFGKKCKL